MTGLIGLVFAPTDPIVPADAQSGLTGLIAPALVRSGPTGQTHGPIALLRDPIALRLDQTGPRRGQTAPQRGLNVLPQDPTGPQRGPTDRRHVQVVVQRGRTGPQRGPIVPQHVRVVRPLAPAAAGRERVNAPRMFSASRAPGLSKAPARARKAAARNSVVDREGGPAAGRTASNRPRPD